MDDAESYPFRRNTDPSGRGRHIALVGDRYPRTQCLILYLEIVRIEEPPRPTDREVTCLSCGGPLHGREGRFLLKYFLTDRPKRRAYIAAVAQASQKGRKR